jgi:hypothetical protein
MVQSMTRMMSKGLRALGLIFLLMVSVTQADFVEDVLPVVAEYQTEDGSPYSFFDSSFVTANQIVSSTHIVAVALQKCTLLLFIVPLGLYILYTIDAYLTHCRYKLHAQRARSTSVSLDV